MRIIEVMRAAPPPDIVASLQLAPGEPALHAVRVIDDAPVMMTNAWVPDHLSRKITAATLRKHALYKVLMAQEVQFGRVVQETTAESAACRPPCFSASKWAYRC